MIVLTILLWCVAIIAGIVLVIVISPIQARLEGSFDNGSPSGAVELSFIHPAVVRVFMDFGTGAMQLRLFGWHPGKRKKQKKSSSPDTDDTDLNEPGSVYEEQPQEKPEQPDVPKAAEVPESHDEPFSPEPQSKMDSADADDVDEKDGLEDLSESDTGYTEVPEPAPVGPVTEKRESSGAARISTHYSGTSYSDASGTENQQAPQDNPQPSSPEIQENVAPKRKKRDNWLEKIKNSIVMHFLGDRRWRSGVIRWLLRFLKSLFFIIRFDHLRIRVKAGVENPMLTGTVSGYANAVKAVLQGNDRYLFSFEPVFLRNYFACSLQFRVRTSLFAILFPLLFALVSFPMFRSLLLYWRYRRKKKLRQRMALV